jgi:hypothetical protein
MAKVTIATGVLLILLGIGFYVGIGETSFTALIPSFFGLPIVAFGLVGRKESARKHAMHAAVLFALLGRLGAVRMGFAKWSLMAQGVPIPRPMAAVEQLIMAIICGAFVILCIISFIKARKVPKEA